MVNTLWEGERMGMDEGGILRVRGWGRGRERGCY